MKLQCRRFIRRCKQGCLQFVILKPILVAVTLVLYAKGKYKDGNFSPSQAYLYLTIIYTISYTVALYALVLFYMACRDLLQPFNPVPKFIIIKSVVFLTYWQVKSCVPVISSHTQACKKKTNPLFLAFRYFYLSFYFIASPFCCFLVIIIIQKSC